MNKRSDNVTSGVERAPMRSLFYAMGYTKEELERPLIGIVSAIGGIIPLISTLLMAVCLLYITCL